LKFFQTKEKHDTTIDGMGSAAEEKGNWSEDDADTLLSLVGGWRIDEYNNVSNGVQSCVVHAMPHVLWCEVCSRGLCRVCSQVRIIIF